MRAGCITQRVARLSSFEAQPAVISTARLKSAADRRWSMANPGRAETRRRFALARPVPVAYMRSRG